LKKLNYRNAVLVVTVVILVTMMAGSAVPALAANPSDTPPDPVCGWDWDRYLWQHYQYELWSYTCDYGENGTQVYAFWNPDWGYWYP
jgi:hypothetical protein